MSLFSDKYDRLLRITDEFVFTALACVVVNEMWSTVSGAPRKEHHRDYDRLLSAWGNGLLYGLMVLVGSLLLLAPGIYFAVAGSLGIVFVCVEERGAISALDASWKLIKGSFWKTLRYLLSAPILSGVVVTILFMLVMITGSLVNENFDKTIGANIVAGIFGLLTEWIVLCMIALQVAVYHHLKQQAVPSRLARDDN
jgi:hypothetical protein